MNVTEVLGQARDTISVKRVFGEPIEKNGVMIIPVARVMGGAGAGSGDSPAANEATAGSPDELGASGMHAATSSGMGFGVMAGPAGAYVIKGDQVRWEPAVNVERMTAIGGFIAICALLILRSTVRSVVKR
jgi:uncharacterized spore protein YtfJ